MATSFTFPTINTTQVVGIGRWGYPYQAWSGSITLPVLHRSGTGWKEPNRFALQAQNGFMPPLGYNRVRVDSALSLGTSSVTFGSPTRYTQTHSDTFYCRFASWMGSLSSSDATIAINEATAKANTKLRSQEFSAGEILAERAKTVSMVRKAIVDMTNAYKAVRSGQFQRASNILGVKTPKGVNSRRNAASNWLEYRYGWLPLMYSVKGIVDHYFEVVKTSQPVYHVKGVHTRRLKQTAEKSYTDGRSENMDLLRKHFKVVTTSQISYTAVVGYVWKMHNPSVQNSQSAGLTNPMLLAWELLPMSFVADWFINVSDVLAQLDTWQGKTFLAGYRTIKLDEVQERVAHETYTVTGYINSGWTPARGLYHLQHVNRITLSSPPIVGINLRTNLSPTRIADALALMKQAFRR